MAGVESVQTFGRKKSAIAVSYCKKGRGLIKINGCPIELVEPDLLRYKVFEPILLLGRERFSIMDLRIRVKGGGYTSQIYGEPPPPPLSPLVAWAVCWTVAAEPPTRSRRRSLVVLTAPLRLALSWRQRVTNGTLVSWHK